MLLSIGERDFRVPLGNIRENWATLQRMHVPSRLLMWPDTRARWPSGLQKAGAARAAPATPYYCLSKTSVSSYGLPSAWVPLFLTVSTLPSADTTRCT
jgi:hypothetical protein